MFEEFADWLKAVLGDSYEYARGQWVDSTTSDSKFYCSIQGAGGPMPDVDDRRPRYRVILLGPKNGRQHASALQADVEKIMEASLSGVVPCGAASIRAIGEPSGPGYTTENRAWVSVTFQVTF